MSVTPCIWRTDVTGPGDWRRLYPPVRRRPNVLQIIGRWWFELALAVGWVGLIRAGHLLLGTQVAAVVWLVLLGGVTAAVMRFEPARDAVVGIYQRLIVPHRVRTGLVQAGVATRDGRLPMIVRARCRRNQARIWLALPAGVVASDLEAARVVLAGACGAVDVLVFPHPARRDRAVLVVVRPRWGWLE